jgi:L-xylulokinase
MALLLGIDAGLTVTKAVLYDEAGRQVTVARARVPQITPRPRHVERDMEALWQAAARAVREVLSGQDAGAVAAIGATAHGDGLYLLDAGARPLGPGILSLDSRAAGIAAEWDRDGTAGRALALTGQVPHASAPAALLAWIAREQPDRFARIASVLSCKDWLRACLTGTVGTDRTEASTSFADLETQELDPAALDLYGLGALAGALPPAADPAEVVGRVTATAAAATGLRAGTPVVAGLHDVTASALGIGGQRAGAADVIAGTYSINQIVTDRPVTDPRWFCRSGILPGTWNAMAISPASAANYDWTIERLAGEPDHERLGREIGAAVEAGPAALFLPFLYGSPHGAAASGGFLGLRGWHARGEMLRAVLEGIAFNHRTHVAALSEGFAFDAIRLTGGVSRNRDFVAMLADATGLPVLTCDTAEAAAWGAALCAGAGAGLLADPFDDPRDLDALTTRTDPDPEGTERAEARYGIYRAAIAALRPIWSRLDAAAQAAE